MANSRYEVGAIVRVKLHQFLTYQDVEFKPGPRLNVVMGPNGTGKSSIVCAIAIGLGASPRVLGRADTLTEFILTGKESAMTEIELVKDLNGGTYTITRQITKSQRGTSKWKIDGKAATEPHVKKLVEDELNIQIGNLCTFLPQEKVGEFSAFDKIALLRETEKALGGQALLDEHEKLVDLEKEMHDSTRRSRSVVEELEEVEKQKRNMEPDKEKLERRQAHLERKELCEKRLLWVRFEERKAEALEAKEKKQEAVDAYRKANEAIEPLRRVAQDARAAAQAGDARYRKKAEQMNKCHAAAKASLSAVDDCKEKLEDIQESAGNLEQRGRKFAKALAEKRKDLTTAERALEAVEHVDGDAVKRRIEKLRPASDAARAAERKAQDDYQDAQLGLTAPQRALATAKQNLDRVGDAADHRRRAYVNAGGRAAAQCVDLRSWLDGNAGSFRKPILGPLALEVQCASDEARAVLEAAAGAWLFHAFVCQSKDDYDKLHAQISGKRREAYTLVNLVVCERPRGPPKSNAYDDDRLAALRGLGAMGVLSDHVSGPPAVIDTLVGHAAINDVVFGGQALEQSFASGQLDGALVTPRGSLCYVARKDGRGQGFSLTRIQTYVSRYGTKESTTQVNRSRGPRGLVPNVGAGGDDEARRADAARAVEDAERACAEATQALGAARREAEKAAQAFATANKDIAAATKELSDFRARQNRVRAATKAVDDAAKRAQDHDRELAREREKQKRKLEAGVEAMTAACAKAAAANAAVINATIAIAPAFAFKDAAKEAQKATAEAVKEREEDTKAFEAAAEAANKRFNDLKEVARGAKEEAQRKAPLDDDLRADLEKLPESSEQLVEIIKSEEEEAARIHDDPDLLRRYQDLAKKYEKLKRRVDAMDDENARAQGALDALKAPWEKRLRDALADLKVKFKDYMSTLNARGDVDIEANETVAKWGLVIKVAFRDSSDLQPLAAHVQSGGERSVSTIMFLMALQSHMPSPFRVVDEINQGMDEVNERIVFKRIVLNSTGPTAPQYFLITPKLLQGLYDMEHDDVRALIVYNGSYNLKRPKDWDLGAFISKKRKLLAEAN